MDSVDPLKAAMELTKSVKANAARDIAWQILTDIERWPEWTASMERITRLDEGPLCVGSRARAEQPQMRPMVWTVVRLEPENRFDWGTHTAGIHIVASHRIEFADDGFVFTNDLHMTGWLSVLVAPFVRARMIRFLDMETEGWKRRSESLSNETSVCED